MTLLPVSHRDFAQICETESRSYRQQLIQLSVSQQPLLRSRLKCVSCSERQNSPFKENKAFSVSTGSFVGLINVLEHPSTRGSENKGPSHHRPHPPYSKKGDRQGVLTSPRGNHQTIRATRTDLTSPSSQVVRH